MDCKALITVCCRSAVGLDLTATEALASLSIILITFCILASWLSIKKPFSKDGGYLNPFNLNN